MKQVIAVTATPQPQGMYITWESTGVVLGVLVSASMLIGIAVKVVSKFNSITNSIRDLREDLNSHTKSLEQTQLLNDKLFTFEKRLDVHLQDYVNHKDADLLAINGLKEKIEHKAEKAEGYFKELRIEIKDIQGFLNKQQNFRIRNDQ
ncbi:hypothetical protein H6G74_19280 [Nostoc spongiaeforme FACHB-130]|uniref:Uncharacterized protein n=1 Tax=Nostoc spongiaeforme FACHB-130 TaxID=1357510 RepID=A0ABR8FZV6_9NOSO|nr:hypothetical protein [Nostoc spongiaeforme]MBD2596457.1 hypothetical protein [Nostoc spongiaeforme FACHB-130]